MRSQAHRRKRRVCGVALQSIGIAATMMWGASDALAHCFVGGRFFPATLNIDDPCVADELSLPTVSVFKNSDDPSVTWPPVTAWIFATSQAGVVLLTKPNLAGFW